MLTFEEFVKTPRCKPLVLPDEEQPQDSRDWRKLEKDDQERQYDRYKALFEGEKKMEVVLHKTLHNTENGLRKNEKWNEYMRNYRKKPKFCPHCKKQI